MRLLLQRSILTLLMLLLASAYVFAAPENDKFQSAKNDFAYIEKSAKATRTSYNLVADKLYKLYESDAGASDADEILFLAATVKNRSYERFKIRGDQTTALKWYRLVATNYDNDRAEEAYLKSAEIYEESRDLSSARFMLKKMLTKFPKGRFADDGKALLAEIEAGKKRPSKTDVADNDDKKGKTPDAKLPAVAATDSNDDAPSVVEESSKGKQTAGMITIGGIRYYSGTDYTRIVIDVDGDAAFEKHWLKADPSINKPPRLFIDVNNSTVNSSVPRAIEIKDGLLTSVRWAPYKPGVSRIVLDSENVKDFTVFKMTNPSRIVVDVSSHELVGKRPEMKETTKTASAPVQTPPVVIPGPGKTKQVDTGGQTLARAFGLKIKRIVLDAGHGGKDPGATYYGINEKDIVLDVVRFMREMLKEEAPDLEVHLTRDDDVFIPLEERTAIANRLKADLFVSVHVNASLNKETEGVETYVLNITNDKRALSVAAFENQSTQKALSDLQGILKDIMLNSKLEESLILASTAQKSLCSSLDVSKGQNLGVKQAPFYVLVGAKMPSILVEAGFLSNKRSSEKMRTIEWRKQVARGVVDGILDYIQKYNGN